MAYDVELKPVIKDESGLTELGEKIKKFEEEGINLKVNINKTDGKTQAEINKDIKLIKNLITELNTVQTYPDKIEKTIDLKVNIEGLQKEIADGLTTLRKINPNIIIDTADLENKFRETFDKIQPYYEQFNKAMDDTGGALQYTATRSRTDLGALSKEMEIAAKAAQNYLAAVQQTNYFASKDPTLISRLGGNYLQSVESTNEEIIDSFKDTYSEAYEEVKNVYQQLIEEDRKLLNSEGVNQEEVQKRIANTQKSLQELINTYESSIKRLSGSLDPKEAIKTLARAENTDLEETEKEIKKVSNGISGETEKSKKRMDQTAEAVSKFAKEFSDAVTKLYGEIQNLNNNYVNPMKTSIEELQKIMDKMNQTTQEIKSPFDEASISGTADRLEELFKLYNGLDGDGKVMKIGLEIDEADEKKLRQVASDAQTILDEMKKTRMYHAISTDDSSGKSSEKKTQQASKKTSDKGTPENPEVPKYITDLLAAYNKIKDKKVKIEFEFPNMTQFNTVVDGIKEIKSFGGSGNKKASVALPNNSGNSNNGGGGEETGSLKLILTGINSVYEQVKEVNTKLAALKSETSSSTTGEQSQSSGGANTSPNNGENQPPSINVDGIIKKLESIQKKIPTVESLTGKKSGKTNNEDKGDSANISSLISTLIDPKLSAIQQSVTNIDTNLTNGTIGNKDSEKDKNPPVASDDVKNINKNVTDILTAINKLGENKKASGNKKSDTPKSSSKDVVSAIKGKLDTLPTKLNAIQQSNSSISKNTKATQTNTGNTSNNVRYVRDAIKSSTNTIVSHLTNIENNTKQAENPNAPTNSNFATLETAIQNLTTALQNPSALQNAQNTQNSNTAPNAAQVAATLSNVSNLKVQSDNRIKELQKVLGIMGNGNFSSIFGSTQDVQSYINSLETLNKEIANAGRMLNRNDISPAQRASAENTLQTKATVLNGIINGDNSLGFDTAKINNIITLLRNMETINSRIGGADGALQGLTKLKDTLSGYKITVQPLEDAINSLKSTKQELNNLTERLADSSLDEAQFQQITSAIATNQQKYQDAIDNATKILNTEQPDSIQSITTNFITAQKEIEKYQTKVDSLKDLLQNLKNKNIDPTKLNMGNGKTAKDLQNFLNTYEQFLNQNRNLSNPQEMQAFATNFQTNYQQPLDQYVSGLRQANRELSNMTSITRQAANADSFAKKVADFTTRVQKWGNTNSTALKDKNYLREYERILGELTSGAAITEERLRQLKTQFAQLNLRVNQAGVATKSFTDKLKEMFKKYGGWTLVTRTLNTTMRLLRSMVTQVKEVDTAMTNLRKVTEATGRQLNDFLESAGKRSVSLGASLTDYIDAVSEFSRLGKKIDEAQRLGELATTYKTVAEDLDIKTASQSLISTMQAFSQAGVQAEEIVDKFNYVGKMIAQQCSNVLKESSYIG